MREKGYTLEQIADVAGKSIEEVEAIIEKRGIVPKFYYGGKKRKPTKGGDVDTDK